MNYYSVPIIFDEVVRVWRPDISISTYETKCYDMNGLVCRVKTAETCDNGTPITEEEYFGECNG